MKNIENEVSCGMCGGHPFLARGTTPPKERCIALKYCDFKVRKYGIYKSLGKIILTCIANVRSDVQYDGTA